MFTKLTSLRARKWSNYIFTNYHFLTFRYEFGNATFEHFFDPSAIIQQIEIRDHEIFYNSKFIRSRNYINNGKANTILYPEVGTWAEAWNVGLNEDGTPIQDPIELGMVS